MAHDKTFGRPPTNPYRPRRQLATMTAQSEGRSLDTSPSSRSEPKKRRKPRFAHWEFGDYNLEFVWRASCVSSQLADPNVTKSLGDGPTLFLRCRPLSWSRTNRVVWHWQRPS